MTGHFLSEEPVRLSLSLKSAVTFFSMHKLCLNRIFDNGISTSIYHLVLAVEISEVRQSYTLPQIAVFQCHE